MSESNDHKDQTYTSLRPKKMFFNSARAERELGYTHRPADQALNDAVTWFSDNGYLR